MRHPRTEASRDLGAPSPRRRARAEIDRCDTTRDRQESRQPDHDVAPEPSDRVTTPRVGDATGEGGSECGRASGEPERGIRGDAGPYPVDLEALGGEWIWASARRSETPTAPRGGRHRRECARCSARRTPRPDRDRPALIGDQTGDLPDGGAPSRTRSPSPPGWRHSAPTEGPPLRRRDVPRVAVPGSGLPSPCLSSRDGGGGDVAASPDHAPYNRAVEGRAARSRSSHRSPRIPPRPRAAA